MSPNPIYRHPCLTKTFLLVLIPALAAGCAQNRGVAKNPDKQFFQEVSSRYLPSQPAGLRGAVFLQADPHPGSDLVWFTSDPQKGSRIWVLLNGGKRGFAPDTSRGQGQRMEEEIRFIAAVDLDGDGADDLVLVTSHSSPGSAKILFNNGKGYFFSRPNYTFPFIHRGIEHVDGVDLDQDRDIDLIFTGSNVVRPDGQRDPWQGQVLVNNGQSEFQDATDLLWPHLPSGIAATSIADYDGDRLPDVFLVYGNGQNRLLINNGVGKFADRTTRLLPMILDQSTHADWADFDLDGDNDLLVTNRVIKKRYRAHARETCYFLENDGRGRFRKKPHNKLPGEPVHRVYLLDANGTGLPDAILLGETGPHFMIGRGKWEFSVDTGKRLPPTRRLEEMTFGEINGDGFLDLLAIAAPSRKPLLWLNRVK